MNTNGRPVFAVALVLAAFALAAPAVANQAADLESSIVAMARDLAAVMKSKGVKKLAVVDFSDIRGYPSALDGFLAEELITQLMIVAPGDFNIVERRQLSRVLDEQRLTSSALFDQDAIANVGKILGLDAIVTGTVADLGGEIKINARSIAVETAQVFAAAAAKVPKAGQVEELLRQSAGPDRGRAAAPAGRQVQASDVFFENKQLRIQVASVGVTPDRRKATIALQLENLADEQLKLAVLCEAHGMYCGGLADELGNAVRLYSGSLSGISNVSASTLGRARHEGRVPSRGSYGGVDADWTVLAPRSRTTIVLPFGLDRRATDGFGRVLSLGLQLAVSEGGRIQSLSVGLANIIAPDPAAGAGR